MINRNKDQRAGFSERIALAISRHLQEIAVRKARVPILQAAVRGFVHDELDGFFDVNLRGRRIGCIQPVAGIRDTARGLCDDTPVPTDGGEAAGGSGAALLSRAEADPAGKAKEEAGSTVAVVALTRAFVRSG